MFIVYESEADCHTLFLSMSKQIQGNPLDDNLANCAAFVANLVATPWPCQGEETLKKPRSRTLSTEGKAEKKVGGQKT